jgi:hypothetical protein
MSKRTTVMLDDATWHRIKLLCRKYEMKQVDLFKMIVDIHLDSIEDRLHKVDRLETEIDRMVDYLTYSLDVIKAI